MAIWYHSNEEEMIIQIQEIFLAAFVFSSFFFFGESVKIVCFTKKITAKTNKENNLQKENKLSLFLGPSNGFGSSALAPFFFFSA